MRRALLVALLLAPACGDGASHAPAGSGDPTAAPTSGPTGELDAAPLCAEGQEGCPCDAPGATAHCKIGPIHFGSFVSCIVGSATCGEDLVWSRCVADGAPATPNATNATDAGSL